MMGIRDQWFEEVGGAPNGNRCEPFACSHQHLLSLKNDIGFKSILLSALEIHSTQQLDFSVIGRCAECNYNLACSGD